MTDLSERYGSPSATRRKAIVAVVVVLVAAGLSWLVWVMLEHGRPEAQSSLVSFDAVGQHAAVATFTVVRRSEDIEASCLLRALAADHTIVGELEVPVGPGGPRVQTLERTVRTERQATSVDVLGCSTPGQPQRR
ncbi:MAG: DUF4307 domain-containing protein [Nocardioides sp.]